MQSVTRKTISFPIALAQEIERKAKSERRRFSPQVIKHLEDIFLASNCQTVSRRKKKK
jgi:hypothetical protein